MGKLGIVSLCPGQLVSFWAILVPRHCSTTPRDSARPSRSLVELGGPAMQQDPSRTWRSKTGRCMEGERCAASLHQLPEGSRALALPAGLGASTHGAQVSSSTGSGWRGAGTKPLSQGNPCPSAAHRPDLLTAQPPNSLIICPLTATFAGVGGELESQAVPSHEQGILSGRDRALVSGTGPGCPPNDTLPGPWGWGELLVGRSGATQGRGTAPGSAGCFGAVSLSPAPSVCPVQSRQ